MNRSGLATIAIAVLMIGGVGIVYLPWSVLTGEKIIAGSDHTQLHARRMQFARENLFGQTRTLPAWYPRELMGTPFRANLQNFPWIPTRLLVLALVEPNAAMGVGAAISAALAALFTFLFCRQLGFGRLASAAAGWTFACCGFYAARVLAGHLPLLEAYPALPALLWLTDRAIDPNRSRSRRFDWSLIALALTSTCFALAGHPQLTVYALAFASLYALIARSRRDGGVHRGIAAVGAMALGVGTAAFALYPMALLTGRTTRVLALERANNDLAMPIARLGALILPWKDGWPDVVKREPNVPFAGYPNVSYFWDTMCYIGWAPVLAVVLLLIYMIVRRTRPPRRAVVIALSGAIALLLALPMWQELMSNMPGTFMRSPARLMYVVGFALAIALGAGIHLLTTWRLRLAWAPIAISMVILVLHAADLSTHARQFLVLIDARSEPFPTRQRDELLTTLRHGRVGFDYALSAPVNRTLDDVGFFDSIILAKPYRFIIETTGLPETTNVQVMNGAEMHPRTLRACGVRMLWTKIVRPDLFLIEPQPGQPQAAGLNTYDVRDAAQRAEFYSFARVLFFKETKIHELLRDPEYPLDSSLLLAEQHKPGTMPLVSSSELLAEMRYRRQSSDEIIVNITTNQPGYARLLESWDPGWHATIDGTLAPVLAGNDVFITVPIPEGKHELRLVYRTPGATTGIVISSISLMMLLVVAFVAPRFTKL